MKKTEYSEIVLKAKNGMAMMFLFIFLILAAAAMAIGGGILLDFGVTLPGALLLAVGVIYLCVSWIPFLGLKIMKPQEALVLTLFGKYIGTLKTDGFYFVNPFSVAVMLL